MEAYREHPERFAGRPKLPKYKHKTQGRNLVVFELGSDLESAFSSAGDRRLPAWVARRNQAEPQQHPAGRLVPKADHYVVEVIYQAEVENRHR